MPSDLYVAEPSIQCEPLCLWQFDVVDCWYGTTDLKHLPVNDLILHCVHTSTLLLQSSGRIIHHSMGLLKTFTEGLWAMFSGGAVASRHCWQSEALLSARRPQHAQACSTISCVHLKASIHEKLLCDIYCSPSAVPLSQMSPHLLLPGLPCTA